MKKNYVRPLVAIETMETEQPFLAGSIISNITTGGDTGIEYGGAGSGTPRSRELDEFTDGIDELNSQLGRLLLIGE